MLTNFDVVNRAVSIVKGPCQYGLIVKALSERQEVDFTLVDDGGQLTGRQTVRVLAVAPYTTFDTWNIRCVIPTLHIAFNAQYNTSKRTGCTMCAEHSASVWA